MNALRAAGARVEHHSTHFSDNAKDSEWLPIVGKEGWIILSKDLGIRWNEVERDAIFETGARAFLLSEQDLSGAQMANAVTRALPRMLAICRSHQPPFIARITPSGHVTVLAGLYRSWKRRRRAVRRAKQVRTK